MFIIITTLFLFLTALALAILHVVRPGFRYSWLTAVGGALLTWISVLLWQVFMPLEFNLPSWQEGLFRDTPALLADSLTWPYAFGLASLTLALILTAVVREDFPDPLRWSAILTMAGFGMWAVLAKNPLTLALVWATIDMAELAAQLRTTRGERANERIVSGFAARALGTLVLILAGMVSLSSGSPLDFETVRPNVGMLLVIAAGLRLGVLPLYIAYTSEEGARRGFGTALRLVTAASSLVLLARIPAEGALSPFAPFLMILVTFAGAYSGLRWMRSTDELSGRPFWVIGMASLAIASALRGNPLGTVAWGSALLFAGGLVFLSTAQNKILQRIILFLGVWGISSLPFSPTASGWDSGVPFTWSTWVTFPFLIATQALLITGFIRHTLFPSAATPVESQPVWAKNIHPIGIGVLLFGSTLLGLFGWDGARTLGTLPAGLAAALLAGALYWLRPRLAFLNPVRAHWVQAEAGGSRLDAFYGILWNFYRQVGRLSGFIGSLLEGDGGILWALLFLVLFFTLLGPGAQP
jgi:hypothetical protein